MRSPPADASAATSCRATSTASAPSSLSKLSATTTGGSPFPSPAELERYLVFKGSVAIDGISLTIAAVEPGKISVAVIPHTYASTNLAVKRTGDPVNLETDVLAKYVEKMLSSLDLKPGSRLKVEDLREQGY